MKLKQKNLLLKVQGAIEYISELGVKLPEPPAPETPEATRTRSL